ncbi:MAG: alpha-ketoacid dehydrogenase subunit beta [Acidimicrobiales bacterium]
MLAAINHTLAREMERDERVMVLGEDVGRNGGVFRATEGLQARFGAARVVDTPLAEAVIVGAAIGLAASGMRPVAEIQFLGFLYQAFHQVAGQANRLRFRSNGAHHAPLVIRSPFGGGVRTPELHADSLEPQLASVPGLHVVLPASAADAKGLLTTAIRSEDPVLFLEPLRGYRQIKGPVPLGEHLTPFGSARLVRPGDDLVIVAWSYQVELARRAAERLAEEGASVGVLDLRTLCPLDLDGLAAAVCRTGRAVVVQEAPETGGFASEIIATLMEECFYDLEAPIARVSAPDTPFPLGALEDDYIPSVERIAAACRRVLGAAP